MLRKTIASLCLILLFSAIPVFANEQEKETITQENRITVQEKDTDPEKKEENAFSATVDLGVVYIITTDSLFVDNKNKKIKDNTEGGETTTHTELAPLFNLRYLFAETGTELFFGSSMETKMNAALGFTQYFSEDEKLTFSIRPEDDPVWEDPYLENSNRQTTKVKGVTSNFSYENIGETGINFKLEHTSIGIDDDIIGKRFNDLKRSHSKLSTGVSFDIPIDQTSVIKPDFSLIKKDADGESNSFRGLSLGGSYLKMSRTHILALSVAIERDDFNKSHSLYNKTRKDQTIAASAFVQIPNLCSVESLSSKLILVYKNVESNIDFFDSHTAAAVATIGYSF